MAAIPEQYLNQLRGVGLLISEPFVHGHKAFPDGVIVAKPASVSGNAQADFECWWGDTNIVLDAPGLWLHSDGESWIVTKHEYVPGPGPGDFRNVWATAEEAVTDILDFYFGNPERMQRK